MAEVRTGNNKTVFLWGVVVYVFSIWEQELVVSFFQEESLCTTVDGWNPIPNHLGWCWNPINTGKNYQPQLVSRISAINSSSFKLYDVSDLGGLLFWQQSCHCCQLSRTMNHPQLRWSCSIVPAISTGRVNVKPPQRDNTHIFQARSWWQQQLWALDAAKFTHSTGMSTKNDSFLYVLIHSSGF